MTPNKIAIGIAMGAQFIGAFIGGMMLGWVIDSRFSTNPMGLFAGVSFGLIVGIIGLIKGQKRLEKID
jgi:F0F1-type ATP synthase assembly protein I